jgi:opacity protein-like surface antigen
MSSGTSASRMSVQAQVELLPVGSTALALGDDASVSVDNDVAYGVSASFAYAVTPYLSLGVAPRLVLNVIADGAEDGDDVDAAREIDLRARILGHYPIRPGLEIQASLSPGYTIVTSSEDGAESAKGFAIGGAVGLTYDLTPSMFIGGEIGYQRAFTSADTMLLGQTITSELDLSYMHIGLGAGTRF